MGSKLVLTMLALAVLTVPAATAHTTYTTADGDRVIVGSRNEPIYTFQPTGLDLIVRDTDGNPITNVHNYLQATLVGPNGEEFTRPLAARHGTPGTYNFDEGYTYTEAGLYHLRLSGALYDGGADLTGVEIVVGHVPTSVEDPLFFPDTDFPNQAELVDRIAQLEARLAALENAPKEPRGIPGVGPVALLAGLALIVLARRR